LIPAERQLKQSSAAPVAGALRLRFFVGDAGVVDAAMAGGIGIAAAAGCVSITVDM